MMDRRCAWMLIGPICEDFAQPVQRPLMNFLQDSANAGKTMTRQARSKKKDVHVPDFHAKPSPAPCTVCDAWRNKCPASAPPIAWSAATGEAVFYAHRFGAAMQLLR